MFHALHNLVTYRTAISRNYFCSNAISKKYSRSRNMFVHMLGVFTATIAAFTVGPFIVPAHH